MTRIPCGDACVLAGDDPNAYPLSISSRPDAAVVSNGTVIRAIAAGGHDPNHPFAGSLPGPSRDEREALLRTIMEKSPAHVLGVTGVCSCSFASPFLDGRPLQDFGLGSDGRRLVHPRQRRITWGPGVLERLLAGLAGGLLALHEIGVTHGDPALMNAFTVEEDGTPQALWVDLNSVHAATPEDVAIDVVAFEQSCLWPALIDAPHSSPKLYAELLHAAREADDVLAAYAAALSAERDDYIEDGARAGLVASLRAIDASARADLVGDVRRRVTGAMAPLYFLDQTRSDQNARFYVATLQAERTRHRLAEEERTRLHHHRFTTEIDELRSWNEEQRKALEYHEERSERIEAELAEARSAREAADALVAEVERRAERAERRAGDEAQRADDAEQRAAEQAARLQDDIAAAAGVRESLVNAEARAASFRAEADVVRDQLNEIYTSRGWRLLGRVRNLKGSIGRLRSRPSRPEPEMPVAAVEPAPERPAQLRPEAAEYPVLVSIIMPVYNKGSAVLAAVDSVQRQTLTSVEVVMWDDGSTDPATIAAIEEAAARPGVHVFRAANMGVIAARNSAMSFSRGEFICCLDPDDAIAPTYLEKAVSLLRGNPDVAIAYPWQRTSGGKAEVWRTQDLDPGLIGMVNHVPVCAVFRREVFLQTGGFSADMAAGYEDWELWAHAAELGFKGRVIPEPLFEYHYSASAAESRDATARDRHLELATRIGTLHPLLAEDRAAEIVPRQAAGAPTLQGLAPPRLPPGEGRPVILTLPWFTLGGADRMVETLVRDWVDQGRTVAVVTTLALGEGMQNRVDELLAMTPYVYQLETLLPQPLWLGFVSRIVETLPPATIVNVGSTWLQDAAADLRSRHPGLRIIDHHFNDVGHLAGNRRAAAYVDLTVVAYDGLLDAFLADGRPEEAVVTVPVGIHAPGPQPADAIAATRDEFGLAPDEPVAAYVGRFSEEKNPDWLPGIAAALAADGIKVVAVGDGPLAAGLQEEIDAEPNLAWKRSVADVEPLLATADVVMIPSRIEGIPLVLMEALALGTPVVAAAVGGIPELDGAPGLYLVDAGDVDAFVTAVRRAVADRVAAALPDGYYSAAMLKRYRELVEG